MKRALELDPVSLIINTGLGYTYLRARHLDRALTQLTKTIELDPSFAIAHGILGRAYSAKNKLSEAIDEHKKARELSGDAISHVANLGAAYAAAGKLEEAKGILEELKGRTQKQYVSPYMLARLYGALGDTDKFFEFMNRAYEEKSDWLVKIKDEPAMDRYLSDPRYRALLKKMGME
jgi:predicted Zn-dependent protease